LVVSRLEVYAEPEAIKGYEVEEDGGSQMNNSKGLELDLESGAPTF
jgi:hypothetical protein